MMNRTAGAGLATVSAVALVCLSVAWRRRTRSCRGAARAAQVAPPAPAACSVQAGAADDDWLERVADSEEAWW
jgi:hypothetical protein